MIVRGVRPFHTTRLASTIWIGKERCQDSGDGKLVTGAEAQRGKQFGLQPCTAHERSPKSER